MSLTKLFCDDWEFCLNEIETEYESATGWKRVDIPHDWLIYDVNHLYETGTGWYRKYFDINPKEGKKYALSFDGVYMDCKVYVNKVLVGEWKYGYSAFEFDITDALLPGENVVAVRVDYRSPNSRWYSGAGIYRKVWLKEYENNHICPNGIYVSAKIDGTVKVSAEVTGPDFEAPTKAFFYEENRSVRFLVYFKDNLVAEKETTLRQGEKTTVFEETLQVENPVLWSPEQPMRYRLITELTIGGRVVDREEITFGFRKIVFTADQGFYLNDKPLKLHGACEHHDLGALGAAMNIYALRRKFETLRKMGINAFRTSHNMPAREFMDLADEMGFLVISEGFDMWELSKTEYDYARFFPEWISKDVASWVRRDRNHPSLIAWSIGNEIYDTHASKRGQEVTKLLVDLVRQQDPLENGYVTLGSNYMEWENAKGCADIVKLAGYNYGERLYKQHHEEHPDWMIYGSETSSVIQSRGIYHFPLSQSVLADDDEQCSALGNSATGWAAKNTEACIIPDRDAAYCAGQFIWTGFDYIGESTPYDTKNSYFGQYDTAGFAKDSAYIFRAEWTDYKVSPFVHVYPYWDFSMGQPIDVRVTSNAPKLALYLNGKLVAEKEIDHKHGTELTMDTILAYEPGELTAIAYDEEGKEIARDSQKSFADTAYFHVEAEKNDIMADGEDLAFVTIEARDTDGNVVANANNRVEVKVTGAGRLIGLDNGDSTDYDQYKGTSKRLFSGKLLAIVGAKDTPGEIVVEISSPGIETQRLVLCAKETDNVILHPETENVWTETEAEFRNEDIPVRKIEFVAPENTFTPENKEMEIGIKVYPENATYQDKIEFRVTTVLGIESNLAEIVQKEKGKILLRCHGDGEFYLRALCKNGTKRYHILSVYPFQGEGLGCAYFNPYEFVAGGLFDVSNERAGNGIERGAGFLGGDAWFGFTGVDFGEVGSDEIYLPIYANHLEPVQLSIYDGLPTEGGELLGSYTYHKTPKWLTYQPETYRLNKTLTGIHTLVFASQQAYHIKGFSFLKKQREFAYINAAEAKHIYGDKYRVQEKEVLGIGNNVVLSFGEFDFTKKNTEKLVLYGRSKLPKNSIHLLLEGENERRILLEFAGAEEYTEREFTFGNLQGKYKISFVFLPGSEFDFKGFQFINDKK